MNIKEERGLNFFHSRVERDVVLGNKTHGGLICSDVSGVFLKDG